MRLVIAGPAFVLLACAVILWDVNPWFVCTVNMTHSLPGHLYVTHVGAPVTRGDTVAFRWHGGASYPRGLIFIKHVMGIAGDRVSIRNGVVYVNDTLIGRPRTHTSGGIPLEPAHPGVIASGTWFVATPHPNSLDSRYALTGNIPQHDLIGKTYEIF